MNILYLHGLESKLSQPKREILEKFGKVSAPDIDYHNNPKSIQSILEQYAHLDIHAVVGSSMGGFAGYYISTLLDKPALLFNPALKRRSVHQELPEIDSPTRMFKQIVIGQRDEVVDPVDTFSFLAEHRNQVTDIHIHLRHEMEHRVAIDCFKEELELFFGRISASVITSKRS